MGLFYVWTLIALHVIVSHVYSAECSDYVIVVDVKLDTSHGRISFGLIYRFILVHDAIQALVTTMHFLFCASDGYLPIKTIIFSSVM